MSARIFFPLHARKWQSYLVALLIIGAASGVRFFVFADLGRSTAYLTYYPAVVLAALYGGFFAGLLATLLSALLCFFWIQQGYMSHVETLAMGAFFISCAMISYVAEAMLRAQAREKKERRRAESANKAKSAFLARMSHELRTPLNAILGFTEIMRATAAVGTEQRRNLDIISRSGDHLLTLINDVLDMAKIDAGSMVLEPSVVDIGKLGSEIVELLRPRAVDKNLTVTLDPSPGLPRFIRVDAGKLRQTIINLVGNAIKFTERGGVILRLHAQPDKAPGHLRLVIEVEDSGVGIGNADQERIFEPFVQVGTISQQKGTGLGLAITSRFVELMGGLISLSSTPGRGSAFRIELPVEQVEAVVDVAPHAAGRIVGLVSGQPEYRILVADDQTENWMLLQRLLESVGFKVRVAENGAAAVEAFTAWRPHFIWMDIRMPVMDGREATKRIRAQDGGQDVRIVAITASVFQEEIDQIKGAGMDDLVRKPYRPDEIYDCLAHYLGVSYERENETAPMAAPQPPGELDAEVLANLPVALRGELDEALRTLDAERIGSIIGRITEADPALGAILSQYAGRFDYNAILQALKPE